MSEIAIFYNFFNSASKSLLSLTSPSFPKLFSQAVASQRPFETLLQLPSHQHIKVFVMSEPREILSCVYHFIEEKKPFYYDFKYALFRLN